MPKTSKRSPVAAARGKSNRNYKRDKKEASDMRMRSYAYDEVADYEKKKRKKKMSKKEGDWERKQGIRTIKP